MDSTCKKEELGGKGFYRKRTGKGGVGVWKPGIGQKRGMGEHGNGWVIGLNWFNYYHINVH